MPTAHDLLVALKSEFVVPPVDLPSCADSEKGELLIVGSARCVWDDLARTNANRDIMCVNDIGLHLPRRFKHWYSNHPDCLPFWKTCRDFHYSDVIENDSPALHSCFGGAVKWAHDGINRVVRWPWPGHGSSGLNACYTGLGLGYERIILAGIPYDDEGHYYDPPQDSPVWLQSTRWLDFGAEGFRRLLGTVDRQVFQGRVKSLSGITRDIFGEP